MEGKEKKKTLKYQMLTLIFPVKALELINDEKAKRWNLQIMSRNHSTEMLALGKVIYSNPLPVQETQVQI